MIAPVFLNWMYENSWGLTICTPELSALRSRWTLGCTFPITAQCQWVQVQIRCGPLSRNHHYATPIVDWCIIWVLTKSGTYESWCGTTPVRVDPNWPSVTWCGTTALHNNRMSICSTGSDMAYCRCRSWLVVDVPSYMFRLFTCSLFSGHCINAVNI
jgi:hypothetical protein